MLSSFPMLGVLVAVVSGPANASAGDEQAFIDLFGGTWVGSATVIKGSVPWQVNCRASGQPVANPITIDGNCSIAIISVPIAADITYDPATGDYDGTYIGAKVGPAHVAGKRDGIRSTNRAIELYKGCSRLNMIACVTLVETGCAGTRPPSIWLFV